MTAKEKGKQIRSAMPEAYKILENFRFSHATDAVAQLLVTIAGLLSIYPPQIVEHFNQMFTIVEYPIGEDSLVSISELVFRDNERHSEFSLNRDFNGYKRQSIEDYMGYLNSSGLYWDRPSPMKIELYHGYVGISMYTGNKFIPVIRLDYNLLEIVSSNHNLGCISDDTAKVTDHSTTDMNSR